MHIKLLKNSVDYFYKEIKNKPNNIKTLKKRAKTYNVFHYVAFLFHLYRGTKDKKSWNAYENWIKTDLQQYENINLQAFNLVLSYVFFVNRGNLVIKYAKAIFKGIFDKKIYTYKAIFNHLKRDYKFRKENDVDSDFYEHLNMFLEQINKELNNELEIAENLTLKTPQNSLNQQNNMTDNEEIEPPPSDKTGIEDNLYYRLLHNTSMEFYVYLIQQQELYVLNKATIRRAKEMINSILAKGFEQKVINLILSYVFHVNNQKLQPEYIRKIANDLYDKQFMDFESVEIHLIESNVFRAGSDLGLPQKQAKIEYLSYIENRNKTISSKPVLEEIEIFKEYEL